MNHWQRFEVSEPERPFGGRLGVIHINGALAKASSPKEGGEKRDG